MQTESIRERVGKTDVVCLKITELELDKRNRDVGPLDELAADIGKHGVLNPIIVRQQQHGKLYQVVAGHRRVAASSAAGMVNIPARVLVLDDDEALEVRAVENLQRKDLSPLDEATTYEQLVDVVEGGVPEVAARVGKETAHVYQRLALLGLPPAARKLLADGELDVVVALAVARIPEPSLRDKAAAAVAKVGSEFSRAAGENVRQRMSASEALAYIRRNFMLRLVDAPFDRADAELVPAAGACGPCPKRTGGNGAGLFGDLLDTKDGADLCTDPKCFDSKSAAAWEVKAEKYRAAGHTVLDAKASSKVFESYGDDPKRNGGYSDVDGPPNYYTERTWRSVLEKHLPEQLTVARDRNGKVRWLAKTSALEAAAKKNGVKVPGADGTQSRYGSPALSSADKAKQKRKLYRRKLVAAARAPMLEAMAKAAPMKLDAVMRHAIAELEEHAHGKTLQEGGRYHPGDLVAERRGLPRKATKLAKLAAGLRGVDLAGLLAELLAARRFLYGWEHEWGTDVESLAKDVGVDLVALEKSAEPGLPDRVKRLIMTPAQKTAAAAKPKTRAPGAAPKAPAKKKASKS